MERVTYVSPFNDYEEVKSQYNFSPNLSLVDCTLRDGEQQAGVTLTREEKVEIAKKLNEIGIPEIEVGMPAVSEDDRIAIKEMARLGFKSRLTALARPTPEDIDMLAECGVWCATISIPIGDLQRKYKLGWSDEEYISRMLKAAEYAKKKGLYVNISPYDTMRVNPEFLERVLQEIVRAGTVDRVRLVDTVGAATPMTIKYLVRKMKSILGSIPIEVHCHDDFGLATACTLAGAEAGAEYLSTTMNGVGERAGNAATEEVLVALKFLYGIDLGVDLTKITETSRLVERTTGVMVQQNKAVVGRHAFAHESGLVVAGVLKNHFVGEAYAPEAVGQTRELLIGKKSGASAIANKLSARGIVLPDEKVRELLKLVKELAIAKKRTLTDEEFFELAEKVSI